MYAATISTSQMSATILSFGARLVDLRLTGYPESLVLNLENPSNHLADSSHMGGIAGPVANRIAHAESTLNAKSYQFETNENDTQTLHGGFFGTSRQYWQLTKINQSTLLATIEQPHMMLGFPGNRTFYVLYRLVGSDLHVHLSAQTDAPSWCNLAPHPYFNLDGCTDIRHHHLQIKASHYLPVDDTNIPTGAIEPVKDTRFDFTNKRSLKDFVNKTCLPIDHNYCLSFETISSNSPTSKVMVPVAELHSDASGVHMKLLTDQPGLQLYLSQSLTPKTAGLNGKVHGPFSGICLEPQGWPDALNQAHFPPITFGPDNPYISHSCFSFSQN